MRNTIPAGTWIFRSRLGTYNFFYPAEEGERTQVDLEVTQMMAWPRMSGLTPYQISDGSVIWTERESVRGEQPVV